MPAISATRVLLDIEGTTTSSTYVFGVLYPYARQRIRDYLNRHWADAELQRALQRVAEDAGCASVPRFCHGRRDVMAAHLESLMDAHSKTTGVKEVQGILWRQGFLSGELRSHLFDDVCEVLPQWKESGCDLRVYSSGSVAAQRLFFAHTIAGDLLPLFSGHYDTRIGPKQEPDSYRRIVEDWGVAAGEIVFLSDVVAELDAAAEAGMATVLVRRPGSTAPNDGHSHVVIGSFEELMRRVS